MKKLLTIVTTALIAISIVSCDRNDDKPNNEEIQEEIRKLPSKMIHERTHGMFFDSHEYFYDEQNRIIRIERNHNASGGITTQERHFTYNSEGLLVNIYDLVNNFPVTHLENGRKVIVRQDTFWLNERGLIVRLDRQPPSGEREVREFIRDTDGRFLNSDGNFVNFAGTKITFSNIPTMWRHVNMPEWLYYWLGLSGFPFSIFPKIGYLHQLFIATDNQFVFEVDANNYVTRATFPTGGLGFYSYFEFEYIFAN